ncbi:hypothetical protein AVEN_80197-1 [Araneus ventricosus]|uniref:Uncharacterized protein n=1 Tax=Araneus ventricosus TaxID=182803 RepID=A0A4Y2FIJ6_ARAVE|nr:hypothetical protein AVEN_80197-1 [Araneus ventricosus]
MIGRSKEVDWTETSVQFLWANVIAYVSWVGIRPSAVRLVELRRFFSTSSKTFLNPFFLTNHFIFSVNVGLTGRRGSDGGLGDTSVHDFQMEAWATRRPQFGWSGDVVRGSDGGLGDTSVRGSEMWAARRPQIQMESLTALHRRHFEWTTFVGTVQMKLRRSVRSRVQMELERHVVQCSDGNWRHVSPRVQMEA